MMKQFFAWVTASILSAGWAPIAFFALHVGLALGFNAYHKIPGLDIPMHFFGGVAIGYFFWRAVNHPSAKPVLGTISCSGKIILTFAFTGTATVFWEFAEWTTDYFGWTHAQVSLDDSMLDMLLGICGGLALLAGALRKECHSE